MMEQGNYSSVTRHCFVNYKSESDTVTRHQQI